MRSNVRLEYIKLVPDGEMDLVGTVTVDLLNGRYDFGCYLFAIYQSGPVANWAVVAFDPVSRHDEFVAAPQYSRSLATQKALDRASALGFTATRIDLEKLIADN